MHIRTKIICTIGPAVSNYENICALIDAGMNVARINFSHGTYEEHQKVIEMLKRARAEKKLPLAIMLDTKGPEIRLGMVEGDKFEVKAKQRLLLVKESVVGNAERVQVTPKAVLDKLEVGTTVLIDDGYLISKVVEKSAKGVIIELENAGHIKSQKGVNLPGVDVGLPAMTEQDVKDITFGCEQDIDLIAASFIRSADHVLEIKRLLTERKKADVLVIAKIENSLGVNNFDDIVLVADGIMVARGDLGVEMPLTQVPHLQKMMIRKCYQAGKPVITATQMLESMIKSPRPTRAEVSDVANAIYDSTSAVMLSGETAVGLYPIETVKTMRGIVAEAEKNFNYRAFFERDARSDYNDVSNSVALASVKTSYTSNASAIFCFTSSGVTARLASRFRPEIPIVALTSQPKVYHQMALNWGIIPVEPQEARNAQEAFSIASCFCLKKGITRYGDLVVVTSGAPFGVSGTTNMMLVESIGDVVVRGHPRKGARIHGKIAVVHSTVDKKYEGYRDRIVVISRCDDSYVPYLKHALGIVMQNFPEDTYSEQYAVEIAKTLNIPLLTRADGAMGLLKEGQSVTLDPEKGIVYKGSILNDDDMIPTICSAL